MTETVRTYEFWTDAGDQDDIEAVDLQHAADIASRRISRAEWRDGAWGIVRSPDGEQMDVQTTETNHPYPATVARDVAAQRPDLAANDAIASVLTTNPTLTAQQVIDILDESTEEYAADDAEEAARD